jgi:phospholipid/cholesterol/gamma-HCH transport system substrate-binding protein
MADRGKVRWSQLKVGIVCGGAFVILFVLVFLLTSTKGLFHRTELLRTYMDDASAMTEGTPVRLNGIDIGYVDGLRLTASHDPKRTVEFDMLVKPEFLAKIPVDSVATIAAANLLGDKYIDITKGNSPRHVEPGAELASVEAQDIQSLMSQSTIVFQSLQGIVTRLDGLLAGVEAGKGNLGKFIKDEDLYDSLNQISAEAQKLLVDVRTGGGTLSKLIYDPTLYEEVRAPIKRIDDILAEVQAGHGTAGKLLKDPALYDEAKQTIDEIRMLAADLNAGKGTAGKLLKDEQVYQRINELTAKLNVTLDKIDSGQGTIGQLFANPALYQSLTDATREFQSLAKDIRANPKKFLTIRLTLF